MDVIQGHQLSYEPLSLTHRGTGLGFKYLLIGDEGTPENHLLVLGKQKDFFSPRHRHNFDQFRYAYQGDFSLTPELNLRENQISYHPEGVEYGPQNDGPEERILLVLQAGGASGQGFLSHSEMKNANQELSQQGKFEKGKYHPNDGSEAKDGYQAIWEHYNKKRLEYPRGRYHAPIVMAPENFSWISLNGQETKHASRKTLGVFSERELRAEMVKVEKDGSVSVGGDNAIHILFVLQGKGKVGEEDLERESTIRLKAGKSATISSDSSLEMLHFVMPMLS